MADKIFPTDLSPKTTIVVGDILLIADSELTNKSKYATLTNVLKVPFENGVHIQQIATPSNPASGYHKVYFKSDGKLYKLDSTGAESAMVAATDSNIVSLGHMITYMTDDKDPTGWIDGSAIAMTYDKTDRKITLTGTLDYYWRGVKKSLTSPWTSSAGHTAADGKYYLYSTDGTTFTWSVDPWSFSDLQVATARESTTPAHQFAMKEMHGLMQWQTHSELHTTIGTYRYSGGALTADTYVTNTATDVATTPGFDQAIINDEDNIVSIPVWSEGTYTTMRIGASSKATFDTAASFPFRSSGSYILVNNPTTGAEAAGVSARYYNVYQILIPCTADTDSQKYRMVMLQPQATFTTLAAAKAEDPRSLILGDLTTISAEFVIYARITYITNNTDANTGKVRIATNGVSYISGSLQSQVTISGFNPTTAQNVQFIPYGNIIATDVQTAIEELDDEKVGLTTVQTLTNKKFDDPITIKQVATPANPASTYNKLYFKSDDKLYKLTSGGTETEVGGGGSAGHIIQEEGTPLTARANMNFIGVGVLAADDSGNSATTVTVNGNKAPIRTETAAYNAAITDGTILVTCSSANITINLPSVATSTNVVLNIKKIDSTGYTVIIDANASELIDGNLTETIYNQYDSRTLHCNGSAWYII
jgi:hypothetical protein